MDTRSARSHLSEPTPLPRTFAGELHVGKAHGDPSAANILAHGDNLPILRALANDHANLFRCAYLDPPFNTGRTFAQYTDARAPEEWDAMMRPRLEALRPLIADDGAVFVEADDTQLASPTRLWAEASVAPNATTPLTIGRSA